MKNEPIYLVICGTCMHHLEQFGDIFVKSYELLCKYYVENALALELTEENCVDPYDPIHQEIFQLLEENRFITSHEIDDRVFIIPRGHFFIHEMHAFCLEKNGH